MILFDCFLFDGNRKKKYEKNLLKINKIKIVSV